jgi:hypothetical protein
MPLRDPEHHRVSYTVTAEPIALGAWHITVRELPETWTVAFERRDIESRIRRQIARDVGAEPDAFDVRIEYVPPHSGRLAVLALVLTGLACLADPTTFGPLIR